MLTLGQQKYLNSLEDTRVVVISGFDPKSKLSGEGIVGRLREMLPEAKIHYIGSSVLEIAGENDIDISVVSKEGRFLVDFEKMKLEYGGSKEVKLGSEYVKWEFVRNGFQVELYLNGKMSSILDEQIRTHDILQNNINLKKEYEKLKLNLNSRPWKEYMSAKMEFFNRILTEAAAEIETEIGQN